MGISNQQNFCGYHIPVRKSLTTSQLGNFVQRFDFSVRLSPLSGQIISVSDLIPESATGQEAEEQVQKRFKTVQEWEESKVMCIIMLPY